MLQKGTQNNNKPKNIDQLIERGKKIYESLNIEKTHAGKYIAIDVDSQKYFIGETRDEAVQAGKEVLPNVLFFVKRVGGVDTVARSYPFPIVEKSIHACFL